MDTPRDEEGQGDFTKASTDSTLPDLDNIETLDHMRKERKYPSWMAAGALAAQKLGAAGQEAAKGMSGPTIPITGYQAPQNGVGHYKALLQPKYTPGMTFLEYAKQHEDL